MLRNLILSLITLSFATAALPSQASAQTQSATYSLENVMLGTGGSQMTGTFTWVYQVGDFENGVGTFTDIYVPGFGSVLSDFSYTIEIDQIEVTLSQSWHGLGVDIMLRLTSDLSLTQPAFINTATSTYMLENGTISQGPVTDGWVETIPDLDLVVSGTCPSLTFDIERATPSGSVALLYANNTGTFVVPNGFPCAGTTLGLNSSVALAATLQADTLGTATLSANVPAGACGTFYVQALDLTTCGTSVAVLLP